MANPARGLEKPNHRIRYQSIKIQRNKIPEL